jgi:hypothetical protein
MRSFTCIFLAFVVGSRGEFINWPIFSDSAAYVSPPIGFGCLGGTISARILLNEDDSTTKFLSILSEGQLAGWRNLRVDFPTTPTNAIASSHFSSIYDQLNLSLPLLKGSPERYYLVLTFPTSKADDADLLIPSGNVSVDWIQADGSFIQFQYVYLPNGLRVVANLLLIVAALYAGHMLLNYKTANRLQFFYLCVLTFGVAFLHVWINGLQIESETGARETWASNYFPSILEKVFDLLEVLVYVVTALGWQTLRTSLSDQEIQLMLVLSTFSLVFGGFEIACGDDQIQCGGYTSARMLMHMFGYLAAIVAFNYHIAFLTAHIRENSIASTQSGVMYIKLSQFRWFRIIFLLFIVQPTVAVILRADILDWVDDWLFLTLFWASKLALIGAVAIVFRPIVLRMPLVDLALRRQRQVQQQT